MRTLKFLATISCQRSLIFLSLAVISIAAFFSMQTVHPDSKYYLSFFYIATTTNDKVFYRSLDSLPTVVIPTAGQERVAFTSETSTNEPFSFLLKDTQGCIMPWLCYRVLRQDSSGQWVEILAYPDSSFAYKTRSRYHATENIITPISLRKQPNHELGIMVLFACVLLYAITGAICRYAIPQKNEF